MKYFCRNEERVDTAYYEFQKGDWTREQKHWKENSIVIEDMDYDRFVFDAVAPVLENYDHYGVNIVLPKQWEEIKERAVEIGGHVKEAIEEADVWVKKVFPEYGCFTILGV